MTQFWQHTDPLKCPHGHEMIWLGSNFWICPTRTGCGKIYVEHPDREPAPNDLQWPWDGDGREVSG